jgi:hypothetical protein
MYRVLQKPDGDELSTAQTAALASNVSVGIPNIWPQKANGLNVIGLELILSASISQSAASAWSVDQLIDTLYIKKGATTLFKIQGRDQLQKVFHIYTGNLPNTQFNTNAQEQYVDPGSAGATGNSSDQLNCYLPLRFSTQDAPPVITLQVLKYSTITNCTGGSATLQVRWYYSSGAVSDDTIHIVVSPTALNANTEIDLGLQFSEKSTVDEVWLEIDTDANLTYQYFQNGSTKIYDNESSLDLKYAETVPPVFSHIAGFFKMMMPQGVQFATQGSTSQANRLIVEFGASETPTYYLVLTPSSASKAGTIQSARAKSAAPGLPRRA